MNMESTILQIPLEDIIPNRFQPRLNFDDDALQELAQSIKEHGIIQPLVLRKLGDKYEIIAGERRYKASQIAGLTSVPAVISNIDDEKSAEIALVENIQRKNLTSIEEAKSYKNILDRGYLTQEQLAEKLGISQSTIANKLRLLNLCDEVQDALLKEKISERHARALLTIKDPSEQVKWLNKIINDRLTVRQLDIEIKKSQKTESDDELDIPIVDMTPNIEQIKENALDIHPQEGLHDIEKMLKPSETTEKSFDLSNPIDNVETLDIDDDDEPTSDTDVLDVDSLDTEENNDNRPPNTFINFLEDEAANMSEEDSLDDFSDSNIPSISRDNDDNLNSTENSKENTNDYAVDDTFVINNNDDDNNSYESPTSNNNFETTASENDETYTSSNNISTNDNDFFNFEDPDDGNKNNITSDEQISNDFNDDSSVETNGVYFNSGNNDNDSNDFNDTGIVQGNFFNFGSDEESNDDNNDFSNNNNFNEIESNENNTIEQIDENDNNNVIEEYEQPQEDVFDPMSMVNTLENNYEEQSENEEQGIDLTTAIEKFREVRDQLESAGFNITLDEADTGDSYKINIDIIK